MDFELIDKILIGIRFQINNKILDNMGRILDSVLFSNGSPFSPEFFPKVQNDIKSSRLFNEDSGSSLLITFNDIIFTNNNIKSLLELEAFIKDYEKYIFQNIIEKNKITRINRYGIIYFFKIENSENIKKLVNYFIKDFEKNNNMMDFKFSKRYLTEKAVANPEKYKDFLNIIYNITKKPDENNINIAIDYQEMFDPQLNDARQSSFRGFYLDSRNKLEKEIFEQFNKILN